MSSNRSNVGKTESMVFSTKRKRGKTADFEVKCGGSSIKRVHSVRYLGVVLDECLSGEDHALATISKISARIAFLYRNAHLLTFRCKQTLCTALIQPYFDYCCSSWYTGLAVKHKKKLDVLQRKIWKVLGFTTEGPLAYLALLLFNYIYLTKNCKNS